MVIRINSNTINISIDTAVMDISIRVNITISNHCDYCFSLGVPAFHDHLDHDHAHRYQCDQHYALLIMINTMSINFMNRSGMPVLLCRVCCCCRLQLDYDPIMNGDWLNPSDSQMRLRPPTACMLPTQSLKWKGNCFWDFFVTANVFNLCSMTQQKGTGFQIYCLGLNIQKTNSLQLLCTAIVAVYHCIYFHHRHWTIGWDILIQLLNQIFR